VRTAVEIPVITAVEISPTRVRWRWEIIVGGRRRMGSSSGGRSIVRFRR
jgi:hypothetical protein